MTDAGSDLWPDADGQGDGELDVDADAAFLDRVGGELDAVAAVLERLDDPGGARCDECGQNFDAEELMADPSRTRCGQHSHRPAGPAASEWTVAVFAGDDPLALGG